MYTYLEDPEVMAWDDKSNLKIGRFCSLSRGITFILGGNHLYKNISQYPLRRLIDGIINEEHYSNGDILVENEVWIGTNATILSGVTIGNGSVIGAEAVIAKNVEPYSIVVGNPARTIKKRFSDEEIEMLLEIQWWNWDLEKIKENKELLLSSDVQSLYRKFTDD